VVAQKEVSEAVVIVAHASAVRPWRGGHGVIA
jgi:hypothetical protein